MGSFIVGVFVMFVILLFVGFFILYMFLCKLMKNKRKFVYIVMYVIMVFFIFFVYYVVVEIFGYFFLWLIVLVFLVVVMIMMFVYWKVKYDLEMRFIVKGFFWMNFVLFFIVYIVLNIGGIVFCIFFL